MNNINRDQKFIFNESNYFLTWVKFIYQFEKVLNALSVILMSILLPSVAFQEDEFLSSSKTLPILTAGRCSKEIVSRDDETPDIFSCLIFFGKNFFLETWSIRIRQDMWILEVFIGTPGPGVYQNFEHKCCHLIIMKQLCVKGSSSNNAQRAPMVVNSGILLHSLRLTGWPK